MRAIRGGSGTRRRGERQTWRMTRRELKQTLSRQGRKWVREVWDAAARISADIERLSPVSAPLNHRLVESYAVAEGLDGGEVQRALRIAALVGYATRVVVAQPTEQPSLRPSDFQLGQHPDVERLAADPERLLDPIRTIASERFEATMTLPSEIWRSYVAVAANKLQGQLKSGTALSAQMLGRSRLELMLRYGYVLRCLDEALGTEAKLPKAPQ